MTNLKASCETSLGQRLAQGKRSVSRQTAQAGPEASKWICTRRLKMESWILAHREPAKHTTSDMREWSPKTFRQEFLCQKLNSHGHARPCLPRLGPRFFVLLGLSREARFPLGTRAPPFLLLIAGGACRLLSPFQLSLLGDQHIHLFDVSKCRSC